MFQQDNNTKHNSQQAATWFQTNKISILEWPAQSPDFNLIENFCSDIKNTVSK